MTVLPTTKMELTPRWQGCFSAGKLDRTGPSTSFGSWLRKAEIVTRPSEALNQVGNAERGDRGILSPPREMAVLKKI